MGRLTIYLPNDQDARIRQLAEREKSSVSTVIQEAIAERLGGRKEALAGQVASLAVDVDNLQERTRKLEAIAEGGYG